MDKLIKKIGYDFKDKKLIKTAFTHSSYANENKTKSYERLEFLGDSILSYIVSSYFYNNFQNMPEGELSKLRASVVCERSLEEAAKNLGFGEYLILSRGEEITGGRTRASILADVFEAVIAAIYLDGGIEPAEKFVFDNLSDTIVRAKKGNGVFRDYKTQLQEMVQQNDENAVYSQIGEKGPEHCKIFTANVSFRGRILASGEGRSKKEAEQNAAKNAIKELTKNG